MADQKLIDRDLILSREELKASVKKLADEFCTNTGLVIRIKPHLLDEVHSSAITTLGFHNIAVEKISHYKVIAHLGYWIHRLQPVRLASPKMIYEIGLSMLAISQEILLGAHASEEPEEVFDRALEEASKKYKDLSREYTIFPINEYIAWTIIHAEIGTAWEYYLAENCDEDSRQHFLPSIHAAEERYRAQVEDLIWSLRYHTYSSRTFAMLVETLFRVKGI